MPPITGAADLAAAMAALTAAAAQGIVTPGEAAQLSQVVETYIRAIEATNAACAEERDEPENVPQAQADAIARDFGR